MYRYFAALNPSEEELFRDYIVSESTYFGDATHELTDEGALIAKLEGIGIVSSETCTDHQLKLYDVNIVNLNKLVM